MYLIKSRAHSGQRSKLRLSILAAATALVLAVPLTGVAHAEWYFTRQGAQKVASDYVSKIYEDTYVQDLTTACRPQNRRYDPRYKYHRWVCGWYDKSDDTSGVVLIIGSDSPGAYYGRVLRRAH